LFTGSSGSVFGFIDEDQNVALTFCGHFSLVLAFESRGHQTLVGFGFAGSSDEVDLRESTFASALKEFNKETA